MDDLVIVGGGLAAAKAVERLRQEGFDGAIRLIAAERRLPYERPPLSKDLLLGKDADPTVLAAPWWDEHGVDLRLGVRATGIDRATQRLALDTGEQLAYGRLVLATGATARRLSLPGADRARVLRTLDDAEQLIADLEAGGPLVIVGAGWIGLEVAAAARSREVAVTVLEAAGLPLEPVLGGVLARHLADLHRRHGVDLRTDQRVEEVVLDGDQPVAVRVAGSVIEAAQVLIAVGAEPDVALAVDAGLEVERGIVVNERFVTSDPAIMAIGDVASAWNVTRGERLRVEHWDNAIRQGRAVADQLLGRDTAYDWQPYFFTDQFEFSMEYVGRSAPDDEVVIRGSLSDHEFIAYWLDAESRLTAAMNVGIWDVNDRLRARLGEVVDPEALTDLR